jgi:hypothetical protein
MLKSSKYVSNEQLAFEKPAAQSPPLFESRPMPILPILKNFQQIPKTFGTKGLRTD